MICNNILMTPWYEIREYAINSGSVLSCVIISLFCSLACLYSDYFENIKELEIRKK